MWWGNLSSMLDLDENSFVQRETRSHVIKSSHRLLFDDPLRNNSENVDRLETTRNSWFDFERSVPTGFNSDLYRRPVSWCPVPWWLIAAICGIPGCQVYEVWRVVCQGWVWLPSSFKVYTDSDNWSFTRSDTGTRCVLSANLTRTDTKNPTL